MRRWSGRGGFIVTAPGGDVGKTVDLPILHDDGLRRKALRDRDVATGDGNRRHSNLISMVPPTTGKVPVLRDHGNVGGGQSQLQCVVGGIVRGAELLLDDPESYCGNLAATRGRFKRLDTCQEDAPRSIRGAGDVDDTAKISRSA